jgi:LAO/AO transport system kinase
MLELAHPTRHAFLHHGTSISVSVPEEDSQKLFWIPPILRTIATEGIGIIELAAAVARHVTHLTKSGDWVLRERARLEVELDALIREELVSSFNQEVPQKQYESVLEKIIQRELSPGEAVRLLMNGRLK